MDMKKRCASLVLLLMLGGSAFAGIPLHSGERGCNMTMEGMDCCKAALMQSETPEVAAARLCCALNCSQPGATMPSSTARSARSFRIHRIRRTTPLLERRARIACS